jgi:D-alanyl-D-alanine carboxypeptidase/D-alanyl-D-alanine-endopeptidase (penicillin-binding protein 4)
MERVTADPVLVENLPVAGQSGTLAGRLTEEGTAGLVRAKTGTLDTVRALAGAALGGDGRLAHFAWVSNGARDDPALSVTWPDAAVRVIRAFPDRPPLDALGPSRVP